MKHAREMVARGDIGEVRFVNAEYPQEWLATPLEREGQKQAAWRADPQLTGKANCVGDIGSHVENMVRYVTGLDIDAPVRPARHPGGRARPRRQRIDPGRLPRRGQGPVLVLADRDRLR